MHGLTGTHGAGSPGRSLPNASTFWPSSVTSLYPASPSASISRLQRPEGIVSTRRAPTATQRRLLRPPTPRPSPPCRSPDVFRPAALLEPPRVGHDAVAALLVAPVNDVHPGRDVRPAPGHRDVFLYRYLLRRHHLTPLVYPLQQLSDAIGELRTHHHVHLRHATEQGLPLLLRHAPRHCDVISGRARCESSVLLRERHTSTARPPLAQHPATPGIYSKHSPTILSPPMLALFRLTCSPSAE